MRSRDENDRLVLVVSAAIFLETLFYSVITPLLPQLSHELHLSKLSAGVMTAAYPAGTLGRLAARWRARGAAWSEVHVDHGSAAGRDLDRRVRGPAHCRRTRCCAFRRRALAGPASGPAGLAWIVAATPPDRRGAVMGSALGTAIAGSLFGPALGALATVTGRAAAVLGAGRVAPSACDPGARAPRRQRVLRAAGHRRAQDPAPPGDGRRDVADGVAGDRVRRLQRARTAPASPPRCGRRADRRDLPGRRRRSRP